MDASAVARRLAGSLHDAAFRGTTSEEMKHAAERVLLDSLACAMGAVGGPAAEAALSWARRLGGNSSASILGTREKSSVYGAALANATLIRDLDLGDTYVLRDGGHPSDCIGGILAVAEAESSPAEAVITAILVAYEVAMRSSEIAKVSYLEVRGWDYTTFIASASAAAVGILLRLDPDRLAHAIAIAACSPVMGEVRVGHISMMKAVISGLAVARGVEAAYLAQAGVTGPSFVYEGRRGTSKLVIGEADWELFAAPVVKWRLPQACQKKYPAAYVIHSAIEAALILRHEEKISPDTIEEVRVDAFAWLIEAMVNGMGGKSRYEIDSRETADHSLPFCVAVALVDGEYGLRQLEGERWKSADVEDMLRRVKCFHDKDMDKRIPVDRPSRVTIKLKDGRTFTKELAYPKGDPRSPFTDGELGEKFHAAAEKALPEKQRTRIINIALGLRKSNIGELMEACTAG